MTKQADRMSTEDLKIVAVTCIHRAGSLRLNF